MNWSRVGAMTAIYLCALVAPVLVPAPASAAPVQPTVERRVSPPPPGALVVAFANNQLTYCSLICPHIIDFVVDVPAAIVRAPGVFVAAQPQTGSGARSAGLALASITVPANSSMTGIIDNDLNLVLPRAQNALEVAVVEAFRVADVARSGAAPAVIGVTFDTGRSHILDALNAPIVANPPQIATPTTPQQASTLHAINAGSAVLFQAPELLMVGSTKAADVAAKELATSGDVDRARTAGVTHLRTVVDRADAVIRQAISTRPALAAPPQRRAKAR